MTVPPYIVNGPARLVRFREPRVRGARFLWGWVALLALLIPLAATPAFAEEFPTNPDGISTLLESSITAPTNGAFIGQNSVLVSGTKHAGSTVTVAVASTPGCVVPADQLESWNCTTALPNGPDVMITATETLVDGSTVGHQIIVKVLGPPTITPAPAQTSPGVASGTGYPRTTIQLVVNGAPQACHAPVPDDGKWLCTIANGPGTYSVSARQSFSPQEVSAASAAVTLVVHAAPPVEPPPPVAPPPAQPAPVIPPPAVAPEQPAPEPQPSPSHREDALSQPWLDRPIFPGQSGQGPTIREALTNWGSPTDFGTQLPTLAATISGGDWAWAPLLALLFVLLFALPLRLLATALRGRIRAPRLDLLGRNRSRPTTVAATIEDARPRNPWLMGAIPLAATAGMIVLAGGMGGEVRYLRLLFAVGLGLAILNVVGVAVTTSFAATKQKVDSWLRFLPVLLLAAAAAALFSRVTGIEPPLVSGVLIGAGFALAVPARARAMVNLSQVGVVLGLAILAWIGHGWLGAVVGFWPSVLSETLATICLVGIGSAVILLLPVGALPGRVILEWSASAWFGSILLAATVAAAVILGGSVASFPVFATAVTIAAFAAACVAVWAWANYVEASRA